MPLAGSGSGMVGRCGARGAPPGCPPRRSAVAGVPSRAIAKTWRSLPVGGVRDAAILVGSTGTVCSSTWKAWSCLPSAWSRRRHRVRRCRRPGGRRTAGPMARSGRFPAVQLAFAAAVSAGADPGAVRPGADTGTAAACPAGVAAWAAGDTATGAAPSAGAIAPDARSRVSAGRHRAGRGPGVSGLPRRCTVNRREPAIVPTSPLDVEQPPEVSREAVDHAAHPTLGVTTLSAARFHRSRAASRAAQDPQRWYGRAWSA